VDVLSLFDGMSCGQIALGRAGIRVDNYYASEVDKWCIKVTQNNYPDTVQLGDITKWKDWDIDWKNIDLLIGGSPCQGFSFAGKQLAFDDPRSSLFFTYLEIRNHVMSVNPDAKFILENVKMKKEYLNEISRMMGVQPVFINSALVSAQNRQRYYWTNIGEIEQPDDRGVFIADIIEHGVVNRDKSFCIDSNYWKGTTVEQYLKKNRRQIVFTEQRSDEAKRIRKEFMKVHGVDFCPRRSKVLVARKDDKMNCLTATFSLKEHTLIDEKLFYRKLTPIECERLQTVPDDYTNHVSNTQRYKMLGNGWTVDVIVHILKHLNIEVSFL